MRIVFLHEMSNSIFPENIGKKYVKRSSAEFFQACFNGLIRWPGERIMTQLVNAEVNAKVCLEELRPSDRESISEFWTKVMCLNEFE